MIEFEKFRVNQNLIALMSILLLFSYLCQSLHNWYIHLNPYTLGFE